MSRQNCPFDQANTVKDTLAAKPLLVMQPLAAAFMVKEF